MDPASEEIGTIPAWAGEPTGAADAGLLVGDHPRVGGGTHLLGVIVSTKPGPSPRGRGNPFRAQQHRLSGGTIPAWAGEPRKSWKNLRFLGDHPRVGGGTCNRGITGRNDSGPSPRGRGNPFRAQQHRLSGGTIPAWAGEPRHGCFRHRSAWDHPRVGGGTRTARRKMRQPAGPSPRGRGNRSRRACS